MAYISGDKIRSIDISSFILTVNTLWNVGLGDRGYGQLTNILSPAPGALIRANSWNSIVSRTATMSLHQQGSVDSLIPNLTDLVVNKTVRAYNNPTKNLPNALTSIDTNRLTSQVTSHSLSAALSSTRTTPWGSGNQIIQHDFDVTFANEDDTRAFFNQNNSINFQISSVSSGLNAKNSFWDLMLNSNIGVVKFKRNHTLDGTNTVVLPMIGYASLTTTFQRIFVGRIPTDVEIDTAYGVGSVYGPNYNDPSNRYEIWAKTNNVTGVNGGNGNQINFSVRLLDNYILVHDIDYVGTIISSISFTTSINMITPIPAFTTTGNL